MMICPLNTAPAISGSSTAPTDDTGERPASRSLIVEPGANMAIKYFLHSLKKIIKVPNRNHLLEQPPGKAEERDLFVKGGP